MVHNLKDTNVRDHMATDTDSIFWLTGLFLELGIQNGNPKG